MSATNPISRRTIVRPGSLPTIGPNILVLHPSLAIISWIGKITTVVPTRRKWTAMLLPAHNPLLILDIVTLILLMLTIVITWMMKLAQQRHVFDARRTALFISSQVMSLAFDSRDFTARMSTKWLH